MSDVIPTPPRLVLWTIVACAVIALGAVMLHSHDHAVIQRATAEAIVQQRAQDEARWSDSAKKLSARVVVDTMKLTRWVTRYDTVRATLNIHDTTDVIRYVATADSTIRACRITVADCVKAGIAKDSVIAALKDENTGLKSLQPSRTSAVLGAMKWLAIGVGSGYVLHAVVK